MDLNWIDYSCIQISDPSVCFGAKSSLETYKFKQVLKSAKKLGWNSTYNFLFNFNNFNNNAYWITRIGYMLLLPIYIIPIKISNLDISSRIPGFSSVSFKPFAILFRTLAFRAAKDIIHNIL